MSYYHESSSEWKKVKKQFIKIAPKYCFECFDTGELEVDHVKPLHKGGENVVDNLQYLCLDCHEKKTKSDHSDFMFAFNARRFRPRESHPGAV